MVTVEEGTLKPGQALQLDVDHAGAVPSAPTIRRRISCTGARQVLARPCRAEGSLVSPDRLRFDFSHPKPISDEELARVEDIANRVLLENTPVNTRLMGVDDAIASRRPRAVRRNGDEVRVVSMGADARGLERLRLVSRALRRHPCSAHRRYRPDLGGRRGAVAGTSRQLEDDDRHAGAPSSEPAGEETRAVAGLMKAPIVDVEARLETLIEDRKRLERELSETKKKLAMGGGIGQRINIKDVAGVKYFRLSVSVDALGI